MASFQACCALAHQCAGLHPELFEQEASNPWYFTLKTRTKSKKHASPEEVPGF